MNLVSIQGKYASGYYLTGETLQIAHQLMKGLADHNYLIITSKFRTDILYSSMHEKNDTIIKLWCWYMNKDFLNIEYKKFFRAYTAEESLINFFNRLNWLKQFEPWFNEYMSAFYAAIETQKNVVSDILVDCVENLPFLEIKEMNGLSASTKNAYESMDLKTIVTRALTNRSLN